MHTVAISLSQEFIVSDLLDDIDDDKKVGLGGKDITGMCKYFQFM